MHAQTHIHTQTHTHMRVHTDPQYVNELRNRRVGAPQWGAADEEIKVPSVENTELKRSL